MCGGAGVSSSWLVSGCLWVLWLPGGPGGSHLPVCLISQLLAQGALMAKAQKLKWKLLSIFQASAFVVSANKSHVWAQ